MAHIKRVLLTGATGFIGRHALAALTERGFEVHAVSSRHAEPPASGVFCHCADLLDPAAASRVTEAVRPTHLLHFAWYAEPGKFWRSAENFRWLEASSHLLRRFCECGGRRVVMAGSCAEYDWNYGFCSEAVTPCNPATPYGVCKNALRQIMAACCAEKRLSGAWARIFFLYGPREHPSRLLASVVRSSLRNEPVLCSHGWQYRDFLHVEDVASACVALLDSDAEGPVNIASGRPVTLREFVLAAVDRLGSRDRVQFGAVPARKDEPPLLVADVRRLRDEVGWTQRFELVAGIEQAISWWKSAFTANQQSVLQCSGREGS